MSLAPAAGSDPRQLAPSAVGESVGRYVVIEEVGRGGMGRVLRAYDPKLQREVALKEVRDAALDAEASRRLASEARAMAKLSHPNVVAVYDVEEPRAGRLVLVMEYVPGITLRAWLRAAPRPWQDIVDRFVAAGRGLAAAHAIRMLHRDFKPANVLVADSGIVKVTDFGLAKATADASSGPAASGELSLDEELTEAGVVLGTPRYMAPEQRRGQQLTEAADQYAFCVALWEALCGEPPFAGKGLLRLDDAGPPPWPRTGVPRPVADAVRRGLAVSPDERWPNMNALLEALAFDPRSRRWRVAWALGAIAIAGMSGSIWHGWATAQGQRCTGAPDSLDGAWDEARREQSRDAMLAIEAPYVASVWERTESDLDRYVTEWTEMHVEACEATTLRGEQSAAVMDLRMACLHRAKVDLSAVTSVLAHADEGVVRNAHVLTGGLADLSRCADIEALQAEVEPPPPDESEAVESLRARLARAKAEREAGRYDAALAEVEAAQAALSEISYGPLQTEVAIAKGAVLERLGQYEASDDALQHALASASRWRQREEMTIAATSLMRIVGARQRRPVEGLRYRELARGLAHGDPLPEASFHGALADILRAQGKPGDAEPEYRRALALVEASFGTGHARAATARNNLAGALLEQGEAERAEAEYLQALASQEQALGSGHPDVAITRSNLAGALLAQGEHAEAEREIRRALALREASLGREHPDVAASRSNLALVLLERGKPDEAEAQLRAALPVMEQARGADHPDLADVRGNLANALYAQKRYAEAEVQYRRGLEVLETTLGPEHPGVGTSRQNLANVLSAQGDPVAAEAEYRRALSILEKALGPEHLHVAIARTNLAVFLLDLGHAEEARDMAEPALRMEDDGAIPPGIQGQTAFVFARALWATATDDAARDRAIEAAERAKEALVRAGDSNGAEETTAWLSRHRAR